MTRQKGFGITFGALATLLIITYWAQFPGGWTPKWLSAQRQAYAALWPQGWAFFASQGDSPAVAAYRISDSGTPESAVVPQISSENNWGLGLSSSAYFTQAAFLALQIPAGGWTPCTAPTPGECRTSAVVHIADRFVPPLLCGDILFVRYLPGDDFVPSRSPNRSALASKAEVSCA